MARTSTGPDDTGGGAPPPLTRKNWDVHLDVDAEHRRRHNAGSGRGSLGDERRGYMPLRRPALDDLLELVRLKHLTHSQVTLLLWLGTQAGFRAGRLGVVLGTPAEIARTAHTRWHNVKDAADAGRRLGLLDGLWLETGKRAGYRWTYDGYAWLAGADADQPRPQQMLDALSGQGLVRDRTDGADGPLPVPAAATDGPDPEPPPARTAGRYGGPAVDPFAAPPPANTNPAARRPDDRR